MKKKKVKGFTLVEILVVIAIIGILVGILLVALRPAREQAKDNRIESDMLQLQNLAENIYLDEGNYNNINCLTGSQEVIAICDDVNRWGSSVQIYPDPPTQEYCAFASLSTGEEFCVDYQGFADKLISPACSSPPYICAP